VKRVIRGMALAAIREAVAHRLAGDAGDLSGRLQDGLDEDECDAS
jgi:hypothetical protein